MDKFELGKASVHEDGVDRISNLPDPVLLLILAGVRSTKESIRTSVLSKRWRHTWTSLPSLDLDYHGGREISETCKFQNVVDRALSHRSVGLDSFRVSCSVFFSASILERWIHATVKRNVKQIDLSFRAKEESENMVMPDCLVTCASLEVLRLSLRRRLILPSFSGFPSLRALKLMYVELSDEGLVKQFLESCPSLEDLTLDNCRLHKIDVLCITCPNLKKLSVNLNHGVNGELRGCLKLVCPNLVFLEIQGHAALDYIFERLYSLKEAVIDTSSDISAALIHTLSRLFHITSHVEFLRTNLLYLCEYCINAARDPALSNLKTLELTTTNDDYTVKYLKEILKNCPKLESLVLTVDNCIPYEEEKEEYDETDYPNLDGVGTWNLTPDVAWVEFFEFNGEMPKLTVKLYDNKPEWESVVAKWGNEANVSH